ncbi:hypothetical protein K438DRAFT_816283 [Mycena galopus ATCC 62051]|nr:hypothetical protein K438DRAFT_816283 [Mycena galopus ATCC 62051]
MVADLLPSRLPWLSIASLSYLRLSSAFGRPPVCRLTHSHLKLHSAPAVTVPRTSWLRCADPTPEALRRICIRFLIAACIRLSTPMCTPPTSLRPVQAQGI